VLEQRLAYRPAVPKLRRRRAVASSDFRRERAALLVQRVFRGFAGSSRWMRLSALRRSQQESGGRLVVALRERSKARLFRYSSIALIQARYKGVLFRARLRILHRNATKVLCKYRSYKCREDLRTAAMRARLGPPVALVYKRGHLVSGKYLALQIFKCHHSYKFVGHDLESGTTAHGFISGVEMLQRLEGPVMIRGELVFVPMWNKARVCEYIASQLSLVPAVHAPTQELRIKEGKAGVLIMDPRFGPRATGENIGTRRQRPNFLLDQRSHLVRMQKKKGNIAAAVAMRLRAGKYFKRLHSEFDKEKGLTLNHLKQKLTRAKVKVAAEFGELLQKPDPTELKLEMAWRCAGLEMLEHLRVDADKLTIAEMKDVCNEAGQEMTDDEICAMDDCLWARAALALKVGMLKLKLCAAVPPRVSIDSPPVHKLWLHQVVLRLPPTLPHPRRMHRTPGRHCTRAWRRWRRRGRISSNGSLTALRWRRRGRRSSMRATSPGARAASTTRGRGRSLPTRRGWTAPSTRCRSSHRSCCDLP
jgi:hypothetical protein